MPLFIPILIGAAIVAATGYGGKKGYDGVTAMKSAKRIGAAAEERQRRHVRLVEVAREGLHSVLADLHAERLRIARETLGKMVQLLEALERRGRVRSPADFRRIGADPEQVRLFVAQYLEAGGTLKGTLAAAGAGAGASAAATGAVSAFATAGTGAAISGLSGAAAESAILAWLGGGSLAAGGGGMALGSLMLGGIAVAPAIAIGGFVLSAQGEKALTKATEYSAEVDRAIARMDTLIEFHRRAETRAGEVRTVTALVDRRANDCVSDLLARVDSFDDASDADVGRLSLAMLLCKALSELLQVRVINEQGDLDASSADLASRYANVVEGP